MSNDPLGSARLARVVDPWVERAPDLLELAELHATAVVACSGGADSVALLALAQAAGIACTAVHVDHGLRTGSDREGEEVRAIAATFGVDTALHAVHVEAGPDLERRARNARLAELEAARVAIGATVVLFGHTLDDQAETALLNFLRGSGIDGLAGIPRRRGPLRHPILDLRRADTVEICARLGVAPIEDPMNEDLRYRRVMVRRSLLPGLERTANRDLAPVLARQCAILADERAQLDAAADALLRTAATDAPGGSAGLDTEVLAAAPIAVLRRALRRWLGTPTPGSAEVERAVAVVGGAHPATVLAGGRTLSRSGGVLSLGPDADAARGANPERAPEPIPVVVPGVTAAPAGALVAVIEGAPPARWPDGRWCCVLDADVVGTGGVLRAPHPGEVFVPFGMAGHRPVRRVLAEAGATTRRRGEALVFAHASTDEALWVLGYRVAAAAQVTESTRRFLFLSVESGSDADAPTVDPQPVPSPGAQ